jgi:hypothetical protein
MKTGIAMDFETLFTEDQLNKLFGELIGKAGIKFPISLDVSFQLLQRSDYLGTSVFDPNSSSQIARLGQKAKLQPFLAVNKTQRGLTLRSLHQHGCIINIEHAKVRVAILYEIDPESGAKTVAKRAGIDPALIDREMPSPTSLENITLFQHALQVGWYLAADYTMRETKKSEIRRQLQPFIYMRAAYDLLIDYGNVVEAEKLRILLAADAIKMFACPSVEATLCGDFPGYRTETIADAHLRMNLALALQEKRMPAPSDELLSRALAKQRQKSQNGLNAAGDASELDRFLLELMEKGQGIGGATRPAVALDGMRNIRSRPSNVFDPLAMGDPANKIVAMIDAVKSGKAGFDDPRKTIPLAVAVLSDESSILLRHADPELVRRLRSVFSIDGDTATFDVAMSHVCTPAVKTASIATALLTTYLDAIKK